MITIHIFGLTADVLVETCLFLLFSASLLQENCSMKDETLQITHWQFIKVMYALFKV